MQEHFTTEEQAEWERVVERFEKVCEKTQQMQVRLLIDAEESWMQDAADDLIEHLMKKYNTERPYIYSTLQMYRWDRLDYLKDQHRKAKEGGYYLGYKLVREPIWKRKMLEQKRWDIQLLFVLQKRKPIQTSTMPFVILWTI